jgi:hypothetical protein
MCAKMETKVRICGILVLLVVEVLGYFENLFV